MFKNILWNKKLQQPQMKYLHCKISCSSASATLFMHEQSVEKSNRKELILQTSGGDVDE